MYTGFGNYLMSRYSYTVIYVEVQYGRFDNYWNSWPNEVLANFDIKFRYDKYAVLVAILIIIGTIYLIINIEVRYD